jgi:hypothetical protein
MQSDMKLSAATGVIKFNFRSILMICARLL